MLTTRPRPGILIGMQTIEYRITSSQRMFFLWIGGAITALGLLLLALGTVSVIQLVLGPVLIGYYFLFARFGSTLSASGIRAHGLTTQDFAWHDIADIDTTNFLGSTMVRLRLTNGRKVRLRAPVTGPLQRDPEFGQKLATIRHWWMSARGAHPQNF